jgi:hypothetical protein
MKFYKNIEVFRIHVGWRIRRIALFEYGSGSFREISNISDALFGRVLNPLSPLGADQNGVFQRINR